MVMMLFLQTLDFNKECTQLTSLQYYSWCFHPWCDKLRAVWCITV